MSMDKNISLEDVLQECENLEFLNKFSGILRETEYRILLIICGHTKHGKVPIHMVKPILDSYWHTYNYKAHLKNVGYIMNIALSKIRTANLYQSFNTIS
jgi:hypothetical protein